MQKALASSLHGCKMRPLSAGDIVLRVVLFRDPHDPEVWIAQALERDIAAHGPDLEHAKLAFERTLFGYIQLALKHKAEPLASLRPAPEVFFDAWKTVARLGNFEVERIESVDLYMLPMVTNESLQAAH